MPRSGGSVRMRPAKQIAVCKAAGQHAQLQSYGPTRELSAMTESGTTNPGSGRRPRFKAVIRALIVLAILLILAGAIGYWYVVSGGLRARQSPSAIERFVARELIQLSIPSEYRTLKNPLEATAD